MRSLLKPLAIVLAVPVIVTTLGMLGRSNWETRWDAVLVRQMAMQRMRPDARLLARYSLANLCADRRTGVRFPPCRTYNLFSTVIGASAVVAGAGFCFLGSLVLAGRFCRANRRRLVRLFRPSLVFAGVGTAGLGIAHGVLAIAAVVVGVIDLSGEPVERVSVSVWLVAGTAGIVWALAMAAVAFSVLRRPTIVAAGRRLDSSSQRPLFEVVGQVAMAVGAQAPVNVVACLVPWLFVTETKVACLDGVVSGRTLCLSLSLGRILSVDEFRALLAHELAHLAGEGAEFARRVAPFHAAASRALRQLAGRARGIRAAVVAPPVALLSCFMDGVGVGVDRDDEREMAADRVAASVAGRDALGSALVKLAAFAPAWHVVAGMMQNAADSGTQFVNSCAVFQEVAASNAGAERLAGVGARAEDHPTDRHPALSVRLAALGLDLDHLSASALVTAPQCPATSLVEGREAIEERLSTAEHQMMVETGGEIPTA